MQTESTHLIHGVDGVNTLMRGVGKSDFLANYPDNLQIAPTISVDVFLERQIINTLTRTHSFARTIQKQP